MTSHTRLRSLGVSLATTALDAGLFALCTLFFAGGAALLAARWLCGALGAVANFSLNRAWAFHTTGGVLGQAGRYALTSLAAITLATLVWWLLRLATGWDPRALHLLSLGLIWLGFTFPVMRRWVFARSTT
jgi:putative flippase GtrA